MFRVFGKYGSSERWVVLWPKRLLEYEPLALDHDLLAVGTKVLEKSGRFAQLIPFIGQDVEVLAEDERPR